MTRTNLLLAVGWMLSATAYSACAQITTEESGRVRPPREGTSKPPVTTVIVESPQIPYIQPLQTRPARQVPYYEEPYGLRFGRLILHPEDTERLTYDDNVSGGTNGNELRDVIAEHLPGLSLFYQNGRNFNLTASYVFGWHDYLDDNARDYLTHDATVKAEWRNVGVRGLNVLFRSAYSQTGNTQVLEDEFKSFSRVQGSDTALDVNYKTGRITITSGYQFGLTDYFGRTDSNGDYFQHTVPFIFSYKVSTHLLPYVAYTYKGTRFNKSDEGDFDSHSIAVGVRASLFRKFSFDASVGNNRSISIEPYDSSDGPAFKLNLTYQHSTRIQAHVTASRAFSAGVRTGTSTDTEFEVGGNFRLTRAFSIDTSALWRHEERQTGLRQDTLTMQALFNYRIKKYLEASAGYNRSERSNNLSRDVTINQGTLSLRFRF